MLYFLQEMEGGPIRIGTTVDMGDRCPPMEVTYGRPLALLAIVGDEMDSVIQDCRVASALKKMTLSEYLIETMRVACKKDVAEGFARREAEKRGEQ